MKKLISLFALSCVMYGFAQTEEATDAATPSAKKGHCCHCDCQAHAEGTDTAAEEQAPSSDALSCSECGSGNDKERN
jgi:hypothetical protein